jgi:uncharacterized protein YfaS (alpha-2-macroglobulin family)
VAGRVQIIELPDAENPLALTRQLERKCPKSSSVPEATYLRGLYYQSRQQFSQALAEYRTLKKRYPKHPRAADAEERMGAIQHPDVLLGYTQLLPAGSSPTLWFAVRQADRVEFTARPFDLKRYLAAAKGNADSWVLSDLSEELPEQRRYGEESDDEEKKDPLSKLSPYLGKEQIRWKEDVPKTERIHTQSTAAPFTSVGAYLVEASVPGSKSVNRVWVVLTDLVLIGRRVPGKSLFYAANAQTGQPVSGQDVQFTLNRGQSERRKTYRTNRDGLIAADFEYTNDVVAKAFSAKGGFAMLAFNPESSDSNAKQLIGYAITDRPLYRPGDVVHFRLWVREMAGRQYQRPQQDQQVKVEIANPREESVRILTLTTDRFGGVTGEFSLSSEAALGEYTIILSGLSRDENSEAGKFRVEMYKKPEFEVTVQPAAELVQSGCRVQVRVAARYYFGGPVVGGRVRYRIFREQSPAVDSAPQPYDWLYGSGYGRYGSLYPWFGQLPRQTHNWDLLDDSDYDAEHEHPVPIRSGEATLDATGTTNIDIDPAILSMLDQRLTIEAEVRDASRRTVRGKGSMRVAPRELNATVETDRPWYGPAEPVRIEVGLQSILGPGVAGKGILKLTRARYEGPDRQRIVKDDIAKWEVSTSADGHLTRQLPALAEGQYIVEFQTQDQHKQSIAARTAFWVHGPGFDGKSYRYPDLEILPDRRTYKIGDTAHILIHTAQPNANVLWSDDARDGVLQTYRFIDVPNHVMVLPIRIEARHIPNFFLDATVVSKGLAHRQICEMIVPPVQDLLNVQIQTDQSSYRPATEGTARVMVKDAAGKPVTGTLTLTAYDKAVTAIQEETGIGPRMLLTKRRVEHRADVDPDPEVLQLPAKGSFMCPEFEIYDEGHRPSINPAGDRGFDGMGGFGMPSGGISGGGAILGRPKGGDVAENTRELLMELRPLGGGNRRAGPAAEPVVRRNFADTALWRAALELGKDGTATTKLRWPQSLTTWRLRAYALTEATQVGDARAEVTTSKNLLVRLQTPRFLVESSDVLLAAIVQNNLPREQSVAGELIVPAALFASPLGKTDAKGNLHLRAERKVKAGDSTRFDWPLRVLTSGTATITVKALAAEESDAMQVSLPVLAHGVSQEKTQVGLLEAGGKLGQSMAFVVPDKVDAAQTCLEVSLSPGPIGAVLDALPMLIDYPYGCTEQTMSRFYPTIIAANTLKQLGTDLETLARQHHGEEKQSGRSRHPYAPVYDSALMKSMAEAGLDRLYNFQHEDGGWGWWQADQSTPYMTAYVVMGLQITQQAGLQVQPRALDRGYHYLLFRSEWPYPSSTALADSHQLAEQAFLAYVLSWGTAHPENEGGMSPNLRKGEHIEWLNKLRERLFARRSDIGPCGQALLALSMYHGKDLDRARAVLQDLLRGARKVDKNETAAISGGRENWWFWWNNDIETNAWLLRALVAIDPRHELVPRLARWLVLNRRHGTYWGSTRDSALAIAALADCLRVMKTVGGASRVVVRLDGQVIRDITLNPKDLLSSDQQLLLPSGQLRAGQHTLSLEKTEGSGLYYACRFQTFARQDTLAAASKGLAIRREYFRLAPDGSKRTLLGDPAAVGVGDLLEVVLTIDADNTYDYVAFEDPRPAGCESIQLQSGGLWLGGNWTNVEVRDDRTAIFLSYLGRGKHVLRYRLRAETPGTFRVLPATGFAMYAPEIHGSSAGRQLQIRDQ